MTTTYYLRNTNSDLTGGADFSYKVLTAVAGEATATIALAKSATEESYGFTELNIPNNADWETGTTVVKVKVTAENSNIWGSIRVDRVSAAGALVESSTTTAEQQFSSVATYTFTVASKDWTAGTIGDRLRVAYVFRNAKSNAQSFDISYNTSNSSIVTSVTANGYVSKSLQYKVLAHKTSSTYNLTYRVAKGHQISHDMTYDVFHRYRKFIQYAISRLTTTPLDLRYTIPLTGLTVTYDLQYLIRKVRDVYPNSSTSVLTNWSFETGSLSPGWSAVYGSPVIDSSTGAYIGMYCVKLDSATQRSGIQYGAFTVSVGDDTVFWFKGTAGVTYNLVVYWSTAGEQGQTSSLMTATGGWQLRNMPTQMTPRAYLSMFIYVNTVTTADSYIDAIIIGDNVTPGIGLTYNIRPPIAKSLTYRIAVSKQLSTLSLEYRVEKFKTYALKYVIRSTHLSTYGLEYVMGHITIAVTPTTGSLIPTTVYCSIIEEIPPLPGWTFTWEITNSSGSTIVTGSRTAMHQFVDYVESDITCTTTSGGATPLVSNIVHISIVGSIIPQAEWYPDKDFGPTPITTHFYNYSSTYGGLPNTYDWDFGDGSAHSSDINPIHIFDTDDTFLVTLTATNANGASTMSKYITTYSVEPDPIADFEMISPSGAYMTEVILTVTDVNGNTDSMSKTYFITPNTDFTKFRDLSTGKIKYWEWDFGDGSG